MRPAPNSSFTLEATGLYRCQAFDRFAWQRHAFGARHAAPAVDVTLRQIHSSLVRDARTLTDRAAEGDALVTDRINQSIGIRTADCVPILLLDTHSRAVAAIHAGWRGTAAGIARKTIEELQTLFSSDPESLHAAIGPCIQACCYEVSADVAARFHSPVNQHGKAHLDLPAENRQQLLSAGLDPAHIYDSGLCTFCHPADFFSYRREPAHPGRQLSVIARSS